MVPTEGTNQPSQRLTRADEGNTITDFDEEEIALEKFIAEDKRGLSRA